MRPSLRSALLVVVLALPALAQAPTPPDVMARAKAAFAAGQALYKEGRYREAATRFEEANYLSPRAGNWFNIARCYEQVGEVPKALAAYRAYLREATAPPEKAEVQASIGKLQDQLKASGVQQVAVLVEPRDARATVSIDGRAVGVAPVTVELRKGPHTVTAEASGFGPAERKIEVGLDAAVDVSLTLKDTPLVAPGFVPLPMPGTGNALPGVAEAPRRPYVAAWITTGLTVVAIAAGVVLHVLAFGAQSELRTQPAGGGFRTQAQNQDIYTRGNTMQTGAFISYGAAGALGITSALLFIFEGK